MDPLSFTCDAYGGFGETLGMVRVEPDGLRLQFQTRDAMFGVLRGGARDVQVPCDAIVDVRSGAGFCWLAPWIELRVGDIATLAEIPASEGGRLRLRIRFADRHDARRLIAQLRDQLAERRLDRLQHELDRMATALPPTLSASAPPPPPRSVPPPPSQLE